MKKSNLVILALIAFPLTSHARFWFELPKPQEVVKKDIRHLMVYSTDGKTLDRSRLHLGAPVSNGYDLVLLDPEGRAQDKQGVLLNPETREVYLSDWDGMNVVLGTVSLPLQESNVVALAPSVRIEQKLEGREGYTVRKGHRAWTNYYVATRIDIRGDTLAHGHNPGERVATIGNEYWISATTQTPMTGRIWYRWLSVSYPK